MPDDQRLTWHQNWLALDDQRIRNLDAWCEINRDLERRLGRFAEKADTQRSSGLSEIEARLRVIHRRIARSLRKMPIGPSRHYGAVLDNLRVAERLTAHEENAVVYGLISRAIRDLQAIRDAP